MDDHPRALLQFGPHQKLSSSFRRSLPDEDGATLPKTHLSPGPRYRRSSKVYEPHKCSSKEAVNHAWLRRMGTARTAVLTVGRQCAGATGASRNLSQLKETEQKSRGGRRRLQPPWELQLGAGRLADPQVEVQGPCYGKHVHARERDARSRCADPTIANMCMLANATLVTRRRSHHGHHGFKR